MMRMSTVYFVRRTLGILVVILVLVTLYWNYKLHATNRKQFSQPALDSLTQKDRVSALKKGKTSSHEHEGRTTTRSPVVAPTRGFTTRLLQKLLQVSKPLISDYQKTSLYFQTSLF